MSTFKGFDAQLNIGSVEVAEQRVNDHRGRAGLRKPVTGLVTVNEALRAFEYREPVAVSTHLRARRQQHGGKTRFHALCDSIAFLLAAAARGHVLGIVYFLVAIAALATFVFDFPISTIFATSSIVAVILGFALQNTLADLFIGLAMSIEQPFRVGDRIELGDRGGGRVNGMNWRATHILAINGDLVVVPNSMLSCGRIVNHDSPLASTHRSAVSIKLGNTIAPARATEVLKAAALSATGVLASPAPRVDIASYGDWAIEYKVLFHFADWGDESEIASRVFGTVWSHLSWAGISQPAPRTVMTTAPPDADDGVALPTLLKRIPVFAALADDDRAQLSDCLRVRSVEAGTRLIEQGDGGQSLFIVREGIFDVNVRDEFGVERIVNRLYPGDYLGEASLLTGVARNAAVEAVTAATVYEIDKADFEPFLIARPEMVEMLAHTLASRNSHRDSNAIAVPAATALTAIANQIRTFFRNDRGPRS